MGDGSRARPDRDERPVTLGEAFEHYTDATAPPVHRRPVRPTYRKVVAPFALWADDRLSGLGVLDRATVVAWRDALPRPAGPDPQRRGSR